MSNLGNAGDVSAYGDGWRAGLAVGALAIAVVAFINLLSIEKSLLAAVLAMIAMRGAGEASGRARLALGVAAAHLALAATVLILFHDKLSQLLHLLQTLG